MRSKHYTSMQELDQDLLLLKLRANISKEEIRLATNKAKASFNPSAITSDFLVNQVRRGLTNKLIDMALGLIRSWRYRNF